MGPAAAVDTLTAAEGGEVQDAPVDHIGVVPMVGACAQEDHRLPSGLFGVLRKLAGHPNHVFAGNSGDCLLPGGSVRPGVVISLGRLPTLSPVDSKVSHKKIENRGDGHFLSIEGDLLDRDGADPSPRPLNREKGKGGLDPAVVFASEGEKRVYDLVGFRIFRLQVPSTFLTPAKSNAAVGHYEFPAKAIEVNRLPFGIVGGESEVGGTKVPSGNVTVSPPIENNREGKIGESLRIGAEVFRWPIQVKFLQDYKGHSHGQCGIGSCPGRKPGVGELNVFGIVRGDGRDSGSAVACFGEKVGIRSPGHGKVGAPDDHIGGIEPVGALWHIGLFSPHLG